MENNLIYKINKYKTKYNNLKSQIGGDNREYIDELSYDTLNLIVTQTFLNIGWENYDEFVTKVRDFGVEIKTIKVLSHDWAQDLIQLISTEAGKIYFNIQIEDFEKTRNIQSIMTQLKDVKIIANDNIMKEKTKIIDGNNYNLKKGGNYIILPNKINILKNIITMRPKEELSKGYCKFSNNICLQIYLPDFDINIDYSGRVFHLDEILCLIPTGIDKNDYEVWFYDPLCDDESYQYKLKEIQEINKAILQEYFPVDKIKYLPLKFSNTGHIISPPLFNRIVLRNNNRFRIIFPDQSAEIKVLIDTRLEEIKTTFNHIIYDYIDTTQLHNMNGNIHCGFKNYPNI
jgi:hypothetical protein